MEDGLASNAHMSGSNASYPSETRIRHLQGSLRNLSAIATIRKAPLLPSAIDVAVIHLTIAIRAIRAQAEDALGIAIAALRNLSTPIIIEAAMERIKSHPWETAALIFPVLLAACTSAFLGLAGFAAGGITAGSIAAGIQAAIGNVAAGSVFATLTSAAMGGFGVPIVYGSVWGISSVVCWGLTAWKKWRQDPDHVHGAGHEDNHTNGGATQTVESRLRALEH